MTCIICPGSEETVEGFFAAAGPHVAGRGGFGALAPVDVAPTLLALLGRTPPSDWTGRPHPVVVGG